MRYNFHYGDYLQIGVTGEKDAGEPFFALHNRKGYDYYSFYFLIKNLGRLKALALGNYRLSFGQGLVLSTDFRLGKTFSMSTTEYRTGGIRKHSSTDEYNYFREWRQRWEYCLTWIFRLSIRIAPWTVWWRMAR